MKTPIRFFITLLCAASASLLIGLALFTPAHAASTPAALTWSSTQYDFGSVPVGQTPSQTFTLSNTGGRSSGTIMVSLAGSAVFSITSDGCTGKALGPNKSCSVIVQYAPINTNGDTGTLTATGEHSSTGMNLFGNVSANLVLSPGTLLPPGPHGEKRYHYDFGQVASATQTFTVTNNGTGTTSPLFINNNLVNFGFANDTCSGSTLVPNGTCTFDVIWTAPAGGCAQLPGNLSVNENSNNIVLGVSASCP